MSLILEALKKSEARRQLGEAPGIGTPFTVAPRRRNAWPLIIILLLVGVGFGSWYLRTAPTPAAAPPAPNTNVATPRAPARPATGSQSAAGTSPATATTGNVSAIPPRPSGPAPASGGATGAPNAAAREPAVRPAPAIDGAANFPGSRNSSAKRAFPMRPRPGDAVTPMPAGSTNPPQSPFAQPRPPAPVEAAADAARNMTPAPRAPPTTAPAETKRPPPGTVAATTAGVKAPAPVPAMSAPTKEAPAAAADAASIPAARNTPPTPKTPLYYELPYEMRKDLPALVISMHVFAADPAQRFVVVDGERKAEGETLKDGLILREIRADGAVFEFRGQPFFYPRPGR